VRILLDTQALLWYSAGDTKLSARARSVIEDVNNDRVLSVASLWEIAIKLSLHKLQLTGPFDDFAKEAIDQLHCSVLDIGLTHLGRLSDLPFHHRDPFDRLIIAQSLVEGIEIVGIDAAWDAYGVKRHW
jgi:PIN domain nuclease of toxin-antitoxin system